MQVATGLLIPFLGTLLGSATVFVIKGELNEKPKKLLLGFAAGVMISASVWSLTVPAVQTGGGEGVLKLLPALFGFASGIFFLLALDVLLPRLQGRGKGKGMMAFAVTLHNVPEGMAVGVIFAGALVGEVAMTSALALSVGIAIQNFPEGAIISMPLAGEGMPKGKAFVLGTLSGVVEPVFGALTLLLSAVVRVVLPYLLSFAAGAMVYVVLEELVPESQVGRQSNVATAGLALGFLMMTVLDVLLG